MFSPTFDEVNDGWWKAKNRTNEKELIGRMRSDLVWLASWKKVRRERKIWKEVTDKKGEGKTAEKKKIYKCIEIKISYCYSNIILLKRCQNRNIKERKRKKSKQLREGLRISRGNKLIRKGVGRGKILLCGYDNRSGKKG